MLLFFLKLLITFISTGTYFLGTYFFRFFRFFKIFKLFKLFKFLSLQDFFPLWKLALPLVLSGLLESSLGLTNTLFLSKLGPEDLAAGALVIWFFATLMVIVWGVFTGISVLVSHQFGAENTKAIASILRDAVFLSLLLTIPLFFLIWNLGAVFILLGQSEQMVLKAEPYMHALAFSVLPDLVGLSFMQFLIGLGKTKTNLIFSLSWVPLNIFLNYVLVFGALGFPHLGMAGLGWGACLAYWITSLGLGLYLFLHPAYEKYIQALNLFSRVKYLWDLIKVGLPMGLMYSLEIGYFFTLSLMMAKLGLDEIDGNQIALQYLGFLSTFSFAMAQAITVRMGHALGAKNPAIANRAACAGILTAMSLMTVVFLIYLFLPSLLISFDFNLNNLNQTHHANLITQATKFLALMGLFQLIESARLTLFGALRAYKDTRFTLISSVFCFWGLALPLGYFFAHHEFLYLNFGSGSYWLCASFGALVNVFLLSLRYKFLKKKYQK